MVIIFYCLKHFFRIIIKLAININTIAVNLINIVDVNGIQIDGYTKNIMPLGDLKAKYQSFGWQVLTCDGHNMKDIINTLLKAKKINQPVVILAKTILGKGVSFMENNFDWHGKAPNQAEADKALIELKKYV